MSEALIALIGTIFGGVGLKFLESFINRSKAKDDTATQIRKELRDEIRDMRAELNRLESDVDEWKGKYYTLLEQFIKVKAELEPYLQTIKSQAQFAERRLEEEPKV